MKKANQGALLDQLARYGYPLSVPQNSSSPEEVLATLLGQEEVRLLEGFPVVLVNALSEKASLAWENKKWSPAKAFSKKKEERWTGLMALSLLLFRLFGLPEAFDDRVLRLLRKSPEGKTTLSVFEKSFPDSGEVLVGTLNLSTERLKNSFRNYVLLQRGDKGLQDQKAALELELLLSELFTLRQKELLAKRFAGKPFTKTEREYYYRVVKKRVKALADERVHQMARKLVFS